MLTILSEIRLLNNVNDLSSVLELCESLAEREPYLYT